MTAAKTATLLLYTIAILVIGIAKAADKKEEDVVPMGALAHATEEIERSTQGRVLEIRLADEKGDPVFEAAVAHGDMVLYTRIKSLTDEVTEIAAADLPAWLTSYKMQTYMKDIERAKVSLAAAIQAAEEDAKAPAIGAGLAKPLTSAVTAYYVETTAKGTQRLRAVNAETGALIANPEAVYDHWTPVKLVRRLVK